MLRWKAHQPPHLIENIKNQSGKWAAVTAEHQSECASVSVSIRMNKSTPSSKLISLKLKFFIADELGHLHGNKNSTTIPKWINEQLTTWHAGAHWIHNTPENRGWQNTNTCTHARSSSSTPQGRFESLFRLQNKVSDSSADSSDLLTPVNVHTHTQKGVHFESAVFPVGGGQTPQSWHRQSQSARGGERSATWHVHGKASWGWGRRREMWWLCGFMFVCQIGWRRRGVWLCILNSTTSVQYRQHTHTPLELVCLQAAIEIGGWGAWCVCLHRYCRGGTVGEDAGN